MKNLIISAAIFFGIAVISPLHSTAQCTGKKENASCCSKSAQAVNQGNTTVAAVTDSMKVSGVCESCKERIEKAAKSVKGVKSANWSSSSLMLVYSYEGTVTKADVSKAVNKVGHDTELGSAPDKVYNKLHPCCKYRK